jgi:hypothetical protein
MLSATNTASRSATSLGLVLLDHDLARLHRVVHEVAETKRAAVVGISRMTCTRGRRAAARLLLTGNDRHRAEIEPDDDDTSHDDVSDDDRATPR